MKDYHLHSLAGSIFNWKSKVTVSNSDILCEIENELHIAEHSKRTAKSVANYLLSEAWIGVLREFRREVKSNGIAGVLFFYEFPRKQMLHTWIETAGQSAMYRKNKHPIMFWIKRMLEGNAGLVSWVHHQPSKVKLKAPPGKLILKFSEAVFSRNFNTTVSVQLISDMREEYFEALSQNRIWKARWVRVRGTYSFFSAIGLDRAFAFVSFFIKAWKSVK